MGRNGVLGIIVAVSGGHVIHDIFHGKSVHAGLVKGERTDSEKGGPILFYDSG